MNTFQHLQRAIKLLSPPIKATSKTQINPFFYQLSHQFGQRPFSSAIIRPKRCLAPKRPYTSNFRQRRPYTNPPTKPKYNPTPHLNSPTPSLSLSARFRKLTREYGWSAFGVYFFLSILDFPFCFAAVRYLGTDRIARYEHVVVEWIKSMIPESVVEMIRGWRDRFREKREENAVKMGGKGEVYAEAVGFDHGVKEAEEANTKENASE